MNLGGALLIAHPPPNRLRLFFLMLARHDLFTSTLVRDGRAPIPKLTPRIYITFSYIYHGS